MNIDIIPGAYNFISMMCGSEVEARIYHGEAEICKTESEAREAAEILKAFFEAKQEGKDVRLMVNTGELHGWQDAVLSYPKPESRHDQQTQPSDYQLRLERYAVEIFARKKMMQPTEAFLAAVEIMELAEKARENGTTQD